MVIIGNGLTRFMNMEFELIGGRLCLDFVNTVAGRPLTPATRDDLPDYAHLLHWARQSGILTLHGARALARAAAADPRRARRVLRDAIALREQLHRLFRASVDGRTPKAEDVQGLGERLSDVLTRRRLRFREGRFVSEWADARNDLASVLWPVVLSAQELLCTDDCSRLKACSAPDGCGWLYYDSSRNRSRRWCSMRSCGNAAKARSYYARSVAGRR